MTATTTEAPSVRLPVWPVCTGPVVRRTHAEWAEYFDRQRPEGYTGGAHDCTAWAEYEARCERYRADRAEAYCLAYYQRCGVDTSDPAWRAWRYAPGTGCYPISSPEREAEIVPVEAARLEAWHAALKAEGLTCRQGQRG